MRRIWTIVGVGLLVGTLLEIPALEPGRAHGSASATSGSSPGHNVFRPYGSPDGLRDELEQLAARNPDITELVRIGRTVRGEDIVALKVSRQARRIRDGRRPATLYLGGQHGREWIPPEMVRRLAHHVVDGYRIDPALTDLASSCRSTHSSAITCRRAGPARRPAPPGRGTHSPASPAGGSMPPSTCRRTQAGRSMSRSATSPTPSTLGSAEELASSSTTPD